MKKKAKNNKWAWIILVILLAGLFFYGGSQGWFKSQSYYYNNATQNGNGLNADPNNVLTSCDEVCVSAGYSDAWTALFDDGHDCSMAGASFMTYGFPDEEPLLQCCCDNIPEETPQQEGDIVGGGGEDGTLGDGVGGQSWTLDMSGYNEGTGCRVGAKIWTDWSYVNEDACMGHVAQEGIEWNFFDSENIKWQSIDHTPQSHYIELCPLVWDGSTQWKFEMWRMWQVPGCEIDYSWTVQAYLCSCD